MHPQQAITRRRAVRRRREAARLTRSRARHLHVTTERAEFTPGAINFTVGSIDFREVSQAMQGMARQFDRVLATMTAQSRAHLLGRVRPATAHFDRETQERLHRFRDWDNPHGDMPPPVEAVRAARALEAQLGPKRWMTLTAYGWVIVQGGTTGDQYRVDCAPPGNVVRLRDGMRLCLAHPSSLAPTAALLSCQIFLLEHDEPRFLMSANHLGVGGHQERIGAWTIEAVCFPERGEQAARHAYDARRDTYLGVPPSRIYARVPVTPMSMGEPVFYDPLRDAFTNGRTREEIANLPVRAVTLIEAPNEPGPVETDAGAPYDPYDPPEWDRGDE